MFLAACSSWKRSKILQPFRQGRTVTVNPRRGSQDKEPWRSLDLTAITGQTIENTHLFDVHLGETVVPYATLDPLKALLPLKSGDGEIPVAANGVEESGSAGWKGECATRWATISSLWQENKAKANRLNLLGRLDYHGELSAQLRWQRDCGDRPLRIVYTQSGTAYCLHLSTASPF